MREMTKLMEANEHRRQETETERKEAVEKIGVLRDIILDLELQVEAKTKAEIELRSIVNELEEVIRQQGKVGDEMSKQLESYKYGPDLHQLKERVVYLENESQQLRLNSELAGGDGILKDIQAQVCSAKYTVCVCTHEAQSAIIQGAVQAIVYLLLIDAQLFELENLSLIVQNGTTNEFKFEVQLKCR